MPLDPSIISSYNPTPGVDVNALMTQRMQGMANINAMERQRQADALALEDRAAAQQAEQQKAQEAATLKALLPAYTYGIQTGDAAGAGNLVPPEMRPQVQQYIDALAGKSPEEVKAALIGSLSSSPAGQEALAAIQRAENTKVQMGQLEVSKGNLALAQQAAEREASAGNKVVQWIQNDDGTATGLDAYGNIVVTRPGIGKKTAPAAGVKTEAKSQEARFKLDDTLSELLASYQKLKNEKAIVSTGQSEFENILARTGSALGTTAGRAVGTKAQTERDYIQNLRMDLIRDIKLATGMSSQELNSNFELQAALDALGDPYGQSFETAVRTIAKLSKKYGLGGITIPGETPDAAAGGGDTSGGIAEGTTATNPQTGERVVYRNGQWQPL